MTSGGRGRGHRRRRWVMRVWVVRKVERVGVVNAGEAGVSRYVR